MSEGARSSYSTKLALALSISLALSVLGAGLAGDVQAAQAANSNQAALLNNDGVKLLNAGNFAGAIQKFEEALRVDPNYSYAKENLAIAYNNYALKLPPAEALKAFHKSMAMNPGNATTAQNLEGIIMALGKNPKSFKDRVELGKQARMSGDFEGAIVEWQAALRLQDNGPLHADLADVYRVRDRVDDAVREYQAALRGGLDNSVGALTWVKLGQSFQAKKDLPHAIEAFGNALKLNPSDRDVLEALKTGWEEALRQNPQAPENHIGLGQAFQYLGDFGQARAEYNMAISFDPSNQIARKLIASLADSEKGYKVNKFVDQGVELQTQKKYDQALAYYFEALKLDPRNVAATLNIATVFQAKEDYDKAIAFYQKVLGLDPQNKAAALGLKTSTDARAAKALDDLTKTAADTYKTGKYAEALAKYREVLKQTPEDPAIHFNIAAALQQLSKTDPSKLDEAITEYQQAVRLDAKNEDYKRYLDEALDQKASPIITAALQKHKDKNYVQAIEGYLTALRIYGQGIKLPGKGASLNFNLASAYYASERYQDAQKAYEKALELDPKGQVDDLWMLATIQEHYGKSYDAMALYKKYLQSNPTGKYAAPAKERLEILTKNPQATEKIKTEAEITQIKDAADAYQKAVEAQKAQRWDEGIQLYQRAIKGQPKESTYVFGLATLFQAKGDYDLAISWYDQALALDPKNADFLKYKKECIARKAEPLVNEAVKKQQAGDLVGAIELYKQAAALVPTNAKIWTNMATAYQNLDDFANARDAYQKAVDLDPKGEAADFYPMAAIDEHFGKGTQAIANYKKFLAAGVGDLKLQTLANERIRKLTANISDTIKLPTQAQIKTAQLTADAFAKAEAATAAKNYDEAIAQYTKCVQATPTEPAYWVGLGAAYQGKQNWDKAIESYQKAMALDPKNKDYPKYLNVVLEAKAGPIVDDATQKFQGGNFKAAIDGYNQALLIFNNAGIHTNLAAAYQQMDDFANARIEYKKAFDLDPKGQADVQYFLGALAEHFGNSQEAINNYRNYILTSPKGQFVSYAQTRVTALSKDPRATQRIPTKAESANAQKIQQMFDDAVKKQGAGDFDGALKLYGDLLQISPNEASYQYAMGTCYQAKKDFDNALACYTKASALDPKNADYKKLAGQMSVARTEPILNEAIQKHQAGDLPGAIELYKKAIALDPRNAKTHTNLATAYQASDNFAAARSEFQQAYDLDNKGEVDNLYYMGVLEEHFGHGPQALQLYVKYLQQAPKGTCAALANERYKALYVNANDTKKITTQAQAQQAAAASQAYNDAIKLQGESKFDEAIAKYMEALKGSESADYIWYSLATCYHAKGDLDKAMETYQKAISLNPKNTQAADYLKQIKQAKAGPLVDSAIAKQTTKKEDGTYDLPGAIADYEAALRMSPEANTYLNAGTAYQANKGLSKALEYYNKAIQLDPKLVEAYYYMGTVYEALNQKPLAIQMYKKYIQVSPTGPSVPACKERLQILNPGGK